MKKRSLTLMGHRTSVTLEDAFWEALRQSAAARAQSVNGLAAEIDAARLSAADSTMNLSSAIRVFLFESVRRGDPTIAAVQALKGPAGQSERGAPFDEQWRNT